MIAPLAPPLIVPATIDAPAKGTVDESPEGLTNAEALGLSNQFGPNSMPDTSSHPARMAIEKLWAPIPWMLEAAIVLELVLGKYIEAGIIAVLLLFNAALGLFSGGACPGNARRAEKAAGADCLGPPRRRMEKSPGRRLGAGRHRETIARRRGCRGCEADRGKRPARSIHAHRRVDRHRSRCRDSKPMPGRWCAAARRWPGSRRPESAPSSAARRSWFARLMSSVHSKRPCCAWCEISRCSMAF